MINKGVELEGLLSEHRAKDKQKDEVIQQLKNDLNLKATLIEQQKEVSQKILVFPPSYFFLLFSSFFLEVYDSLFNRNSTSSSRPTRMKSSM